MLKILNSSQVKQLDQFTINNAPISSIDLMERACKAFVDWFETHGSTEKKIGVICGTGNNGGDGLGISRMLVVKGYAVEVWIVRGSAPESADFKVNYQRICELVSPREICESLTSNPFTECDVLIDAIFGSGLSRPAEGIYAQVIQYINKTKAFRIAVDAPSGLLIDKPSSGEIIRATHTVTFQLPKLSFLMPQNADYVGQWHSVNIGLNREGMKEALTSHFLVERKDIKKIVRLMKRSTFSHKGNFGHVLLIAGSYGKMGAAVLSATAALRSGAGLVTVHTPGCGYQILQTTLPEAMVSIDPSAERFSAMPVMGGYTTVGIGPGIGTDVHTVKAFGELLQAVKNPMVIDADAINILSSNRELLHLIPPNSILTPHHGEFKRLVGSWQDDFQRLQKQIEFSVKMKCVVLLKGAYTSISTPDGKVYFNNTGNPGMATGGSGDVLTGMLTALLGRGYTPEQAAIAGAWLHGLAGDKASHQVGEESLIASDIIEYLPGAFTSF